MALPLMASFFALRASPDKSLEVVPGGTLSSASAHTRLTHYKIGLAGHGGQGQVGIWLFIVLSSAIRRQRQMEDAA
jgi:hypothetical protein